jgi:putative sugar O-methyltransferase
MGDQKILARARDFYSEVSKRYAADRYYERLPLNTFWQQQNMPLMRDIIERADGLKAVVHRAQQTFMFSVNVEATIKERAVDWLLAEQRSRGVDIFRLRSKIEESEFSYPGNNVKRRGRCLTPDFIRTVNIGLRIERCFKRGLRKFDVVELGGGLGHLARTMRLLGYTRSHVIVDLPETLVFSFCFLSLNFPQARMLLVKDEESARSLAAGGYDFAFVPALFAEAVLSRKYDLFVNTASLGEMRNEVVRHWMDFFQNRLDVRYLYTLNRYLNTIDPSWHAWRWQENECSVHYDRRWDILQWEVEPRFTRCPYVDTVIARYVEIAAARLRTVDDAACVRYAAELLRMVQDEDWYNVKGDSAIMTRGDHILAHEFGMDGTLFKLWNVLRLQPSADATATLLRYLETLLARKDRVFEEQRYYEDLLFSLFDPERNPQLREFVAQVMRRRQLQAGRPQLKLIDSSGSFNFIQAGDEVIAISQAVGHVKLFGELLGEQNLPPVLFITQSVEEARRRVSGLQTLGAGVLEVYNGFNIVWGSDGFYGVCQSIGQIDLSRGLGIALEREYKGSVVFGESVEVVRSKISVLET